MTRKRKQRYIDITGQRFNRLVAVEFIGITRPSGNARWKFKCDCGNECITTQARVANGGAKSCGCYATEKRKYIRQGKSPSNKLPPGEAAFSALYLQYKYNAKDRKIEFDISKSDFKVLTKMNCHYCNEIPNNVFKSGRITSGSYIYSGIDRIDSSKGYTTENCVPCCKHCNWAKRDVTKEQFLDWIKRVYIFSIVKKELL